MRALKLLVVVMGLLIVGGTVTLGVLLVQRVSPGGGARADLALHQPAGSRIAGMASAGDLLGIWMQRPDGDRVLLVDPKRSRVVGEVRTGE